MRIEERSMFYMTPGMRLAIFLGATGICMILGTFITFLMVAAYLHVDFSATQKALLLPQNATISLFANAFASIMAFLVPSYTVAFFTKGEISKNMGFNSIHSSQQIKWVVLLAFTGLLLNGSLASLTEFIPISASMKAWADALEATYKNALMAMTQMHSVGDLIISLIAIAFIPATVEELYFRGALQKTLKDWSHKPWLAIIVTAIVFSAFHFSYFGFLSRMGLGIVLGWVYEYTKSIWLPILLHAINNGLAVIVLYMVRNDQKNIDQVVNHNFPMYMLGLVVILVLYLFSRLKQASSYERLENSIRE